MGKNQGIRITIDGACNTGKTLLMSAFAEFLREKGFTNITQLCDGGVVLGPQAIENLALVGQDNLSRYEDGSRFCDKQIVFVERMTSRTTKWKPMPEFIQGSVRTLPDSQVAFEMTNRVESSVRLRDYGNILEHFEKVCVLFDTDFRKAEGGQLAKEFTFSTSPMAEDGRLVVDAFFVRVDHKPVANEDFDRILRVTNDHVYVRANRKLQNSSLSGAHASAGTQVALFPKPDMGLLMTDNPAVSENGIAISPETLKLFKLRKYPNARLNWSEGRYPLNVYGRDAGNKIDVLFQFGGLAKVMADPELKTRVIEYLQARYPYDTEYVLEAPAITLHETVHPVTGETHGQMLARMTRACPMQLFEGVGGIDLLKLPEDLIYEQFIGVRWKNEAELNAQGKRMATVLEFKHQGVRIMPNLTEPTTQPGAAVVNAKLGYFQNGVADVSSAVPEGDSASIVEQLRLAGHHELMQKFTLHDFVNISNDEAQQQKWNDKRRKFINRGTDREFHEVKFLAEFYSAEGVSDVQPYIGQLIEALHQCRPEVLAYVTYPTGRWLEQDRKLVTQAELDRYPGIGGVDSTAQVVRSASGEVLQVFVPMKIPTAWSELDVATSYPKSEMVLRNVAKALMAVSDAGLIQPDRFWQASSAGALLLNEADPILELTTSLCRRGYRQFFDEHKLTRFDVIDRDKEGVWYDRARETTEPSNPYQVMMEVLICRKDQESVTEEVHDLVRQALYNFDPLIFLMRKVKNAGFSGACASSADPELAVQMAEIQKKEILNPKPVPAYFGGVTDSSRQSDSIDGALGYHPPEAGQIEGAYVWKSQDMSEVLLTPIIKSEPTLSENKNLFRVAESGNGKIPFPPEE